MIASRRYLDTFVKVGGSASVHHLSRTTVIPRDGA